MDAKEIAKQLRKPTGENGKFVGTELSKSNKFITELVYSEFNKLPGDSILEIGFGNGALLKQLLTNDQKKVYGIDYSELMVEEATKINKELIEKGVVEIKHGEIENIPYPDNSFDKICTINTVYFWGSPEKALSEIKRVLKKDGYFAVGFRSKEKVSHYEFTKYDFQLYSIDGLKDVTEQNGFEVRSVIAKDDEQNDSDAVSMIIKNADK